MPYILQSPQNVSQQIKAIVSEQMEEAQRKLLEATDESRDEAVHDARKSVKKVRALLRLIRKAIPEQYTEENQRLAELGRTLSQLRDAKAMDESLHILNQQYPDVFDQAFLKAAAKRLHNTSAIEARATPEAAIQSAVEQLAVAQNTLKSLPLADLGFALVRKGFREAFRRGRQALHTVQVAPNTISYHELRKRVKDHWYHVRLLEALWPDVLKGYAKTLNELQNTLGDHHNFAVMTERLAGSRSRRGGNDRWVNLQTLIQGHQSKLEELALHLAAQIYQPTPKQMRRHLIALWQQWEERTQDSESSEMVQAAHSGA